MTIKKKRTKIILPSILTVSLTCGLLLTGCQKTPDQSAVVSKAGGLSEDVIAEPLKDGETQTLDLPEHWDTTVTWSNDRGVFHADQKLESVTTGNLPVIEVSQKKLELEQLKELISYFAGGKILYQTQELTREYYQNLLDKIKNREGFYADNSVEYDLTGLEKLVEEVLPLAPEQTPLQEIGQIEYTSKKTDPAYEAKRKSLEAYGYDILPDTTKQDEMEIHFQATVGADAKGTINAETYDPEAGNYSIFSWSEGNGIKLATIENSLARENLTAEYGVPAGSVKESFMEKLQALKDQMEETSLLEETAEDEAEKVLKDLNLENMQLLSSDKILWYAQSDYPEATILEQQEALWNADPNLGKTGYRLTYVPSVSGLKINQDKSGYSDDSGFAYAPSMPVEQIYIVVTEDGIRSFKWKGMSQEEKVVTENVKLLAFDEIESRLIDQVKYLYPSNQPAEDKTVFGYDVATVELGYTYIPAYKNPQNAWLVPAWFFTISESTNTTAELGTAGRKKEYQTDYIVLNATDGGRIGSYWR